MTRFEPASIEDLRDAVAGALAAEEPVELVAGGTKRGLGRPLQTPHVVDLSRLSGIRDYAPSELVLTAGAATPLAEIERALARSRPDAGVRAARLARPARQVHGVSRPWAASSPAIWRGRGGIKAGAARDHFLGFRAVSGRGETFKAGGKVVKNVTGYDLPKLMAGSYGTLAALEEVTVKVLPRPEAAATVLFAGLDAEARGAADGAGARLAARGLGRRLPAAGTPRCRRCPRRRHGARCGSKGRRRRSLSAATACSRELAGGGATDDARRCRDSARFGATIGDVAPLAGLARPRGVAALGGAERAAPRWRRRSPARSMRCGSSIGAAASSGWR